MSLVIFERRRATNEVSIASDSGLILEVKGLLFVFFTSLKEVIYVKEET